MRAPSRAALALVSAALLTALTGCASVVDVDAAEDADDARCADVMIALPPVVAENDQRETNSQATSAWGDPSRVVLRCGVTAPGPTTDPCVTVNDVDWVVREGDPEWRDSVPVRVEAIPVRRGEDVLGVIGRNTVDQMQIGIFWGYLAMIEGLVARLKAEIGRPAKVIASGGLAALFQPHTAVFDAVEPDLTIQGLAIMVERAHIQP